MQTPKSKTARLPLLTSDLADYEPGTIAVLSGAGFLPSETVTLRVLHADGSPGETHQWTAQASRAGKFVTTWNVCENCVGQMLLAAADGQSSGTQATTLFMNSNQCGTGVVASMVPVGGSCVEFTPAVGNGPDNYEVVEGGTYTITITGVTECTDSAITVFVQSSSTGNFCFNATGGSGTYSGTFTVPSPACNTMPVSYKCGANAPCTNPNSFDVQGLNSGCGGVHLRASNFDANCHKTSDDADCSGGSTPTGACCLADGTCVQVTQASCTTLSGNYQGDSSTCGGVSCPQPSGACCLADGSCTETTQGNCSTLGGTYHGDGSTCGGVSCPQPTGACCLTDGSCAELNEADCASQGGTYHGDDSTCGGVTCTIPSGACCLTDGSCAQATAQECAELGGTYHGDGTTCGGVTCPQPPDCFNLTFDTDDDGNGMVHGTKVDTEFDCNGSTLPVTITGSVNASGHNTAAILDSTNGPAAQDPDLLVSRGNILILQTDANENQCPPNSGVYCSHNDDENGGTLSFAFCTVVTPSSIVLVDIDGTDAASSVVLTDVNGKKRTFAVPGNWTGDRVTNFPQPGWKLLDLTTLANQPGFASTVTASQDAGFDPTAVVSLAVHLGGSGGVDDLNWCQ